MTSTAATTAERPPMRERVVMAWEPSDLAGAAARLAALEALAPVVRALDGALLLTLGGADRSEFDATLALLRRHRVRVLPLLDPAPPTAAGTSPIALHALRALAVADALAEWDGIRYAGVASGSSLEIATAKATVKAALGDDGPPLRFGWLRRRTAHEVSPPGTDFAFDWPPYGGTPDPQAPLADSDYALVATEIARRHAGNSMAAPAVPWSGLPAVALPGSGFRITQATPVKFAHAIDSARRFVANRAGQGLPFWVLRVAFDPGAAAQTAALIALAPALAAPHVVSGPGAAAGRIDLPRRNAARIAVIVHLYYPDLWDELAGAIAALPEAFDLFVSCPIRARDAVARMVHERFPDAVVFGIRNLGRDVLPFLHWLATPGRERYEYVLKLHSKKSVHVVDAAQSPLGDGETWRRQALGGLVGSREHAAAMLRALDAQPDVGVVAPAGFLYDQVAWRCATGDLLATLCDGLGMNSHVGGGFAAGTMFWARLAALAPLTRIPERLLDFEREAGQVDGMLHHAYERLFALVSSNQGYRTIDSAALLQ